VLRDTDRYLAIHDASRYVVADVTANVASAYQIRARARQLRLRSGQLRARAQQLTRMQSTVDGFEPQVSLSARHAPGAPVEGNPTRLDGAST
jgi:hypothetical protein